MPSPNPVACAALLIVAFVIAGAAQTAWFAWKGSQVFALPLDAGLTLRGRRLFGENKTIRGFMVMVPAAALALPFSAFVLSRLLPTPPELWPLTFGGYAALGAWCALGFMLGELPNSFVKRQLDIAPGASAHGVSRATWQFIGDRADSGIGMLCALALAVPTPWQTWALVLLAGSAIHWSFSLVLFFLRVKPRPA